MFSTEMARGSCCATWLFILTALHQCSTGSRAETGTPVDADRLRPTCALPTCLQNWLFGPAWSVFYTSMGVASWFVGRSDKKGKAAALALYGAQLAVNLAWTPLFFKAHALDVALVDITSGWRGQGGGGRAGRGGGRRRVGRMAWHVGLQQQEMFHMQQEQQEHDGVLEWDTPLQQHVHSTQWGVTWTLLLWGSGACLRLTLPAAACPCCCSPAGPGHCCHGQDE